ncbi:MAG: glycosyltransferase family 39 protein [Saprospiraceae bacterium]|nr:glycosyltransferase family 39 protein [Saprospiraceae bacterium]MCB9320822.1 glycosyltransferase family 39 protein [Lewinellaceae bacterium]
MTSILTSFRNQPLWWCFLPITIIWFMGMQLPVMEIDAAQYASIAAEMHDTRSFLQVFFDGSDYLDKPPLLFWLSAWSFDVFGIHNWSYRLPSMLSMILGLWSVYHLTLRLYREKQTAVLATIVYATLQSSFLFMHDIRTDTLLANLVVFTIWQGVVYLDEKKWLSMIGFASGAGLAMLTKGPIGLMVPAIALLAHIWWTHRWNIFLNLKTWLIPLILLLWLAPMLYGLYHQFDLHPEKTVSGRQGVSGIYFYFWEQSFGRITGASSWQDNTGPDYFFTNSLWSLLPWTLLFWITFIRELVCMFRVRRDQNRFQEAFPILALGILIPFTAFTFAHYKLPHYLFVVAPLQAILIGAWLNGEKGRSPSRLIMILQALIILVMLSGIGAVVWVFPALWWKWILLIAFAAVVAYILLRRTSGISRIWKWSIAAIITLNFWLNLHFYPELMQYQLTSQAIAYMKTENIPVQSTAFLGVSRFGLHFFAGQKVAYTEHWDPALLQFKYVLATDKGLQEMDRNSMRYSILNIFKGYPVSRLNAKFLNPKTRNTQYNFAYLVALNQK